MLTFKSQKQLKHVKTMDDEKKSKLGSSSHWTVQVLQIGANGNNHITSLFIFIQIKIEDHSLENKTKYEMKLTQNKLRTISTMKQKAHINVFWYNSELIYGSLILWFKKRKVLVKS